MGRTPLPPGSAGTTTTSKQGSVWVARCKYRRQDGGYADVRRRAATKEKARQSVRDALNELNMAVPGAQLTPRTLFSEAAQLWLDQYRADAEKGIYSLSSVDTYSDHLGSTCCRPSATSGCSR